MPRPIVPAPITAILFTSIAYLGWPICRRDAEPTERILSRYTCLFNSSHSPHRTTTATPFLFPLPCPMVPCFCLASWNHRRACLFHRGAARLVANLKQPGGRAPRRVLRCRSTSKLRQHRAASLLMALLIRVAHVAVKPRNLFLHRGLEEFQNLRVAQGTHGFASHQGRGDALDRRV